MSTTGGAAPKHTRKLRGRVCNEAGDAGPPGAELLEESATNAATRCGPRTARGKVELRKTPGRDFVRTAVDGARKPRSVSRKSPPGFAGCQHERPAIVSWLQHRSGKSRAAQARFAGAPYKRDASRRAAAGADSIGAGNTLAQQQLHVCPGRAGGPDRRRRRRAGAAFGWACPAALAAAAGFDAEKRSGRRDAASRFPGTARCRPSASGRRSDPGWDGCASGVRPPTTSTRRLSSARTPVEKRPRRRASSGACGAP